jgi:predicted dehydrogenase
VEIVGVEGTLRWENETGAVRIYRARESGNSGDRSESWESYEVPDNFDRNDMFMAEMKHFLEIIKGKAQPMCSLNDGCKALELALAAHQSSRKGQLIKLRE